jgi:hypothetical protein
MKTGSQNKTFVQDGAQGDLCVWRVPAVPAGYAPVVPDGTLDGKPAHVVQHSETGHHHVVDAADVIRYEGPDTGICYLRLVSDVADVVHQRGYDTHGTASLIGGVDSVWAVSRQREWAGAEERRTAD